MFERAVSSTSSPRWKTAVLLVTTGGHAAVLVALMVAAFWKIDKVPYADRGDVKFAVRVEQEPPGGPPPGARLRIERPSVAVKVKPLVPTQPVHLETPPTAPATPGGGDPIPGGGGTNVGGDPESTELGTGSCATPPCGEPRPDPRPDPEPRIEPPQVQAVPPSVAAGLRISGNERIYPPDRVRVTMVHGGQDQLQGTLKLCVSTAGVIDSVRVLRSTGYADYDAALVAAMRAWRYRPYRVNGVPAPMCTVEIVIYRMKS